MSTEPLYSNRYNNVNVKRLVDQLQYQATEYQSTRKINIRKQRKNHLSCCEMMERNRQKEKTPFNNKTQNDSKLFEPQLKSVPYMFLSKHKTDGLILPDRAFAKGKAAKRFFIKMKDSSVYSFKQEQDTKTLSKLKKQEKQKTIISRKLQQWQRITDMDDGKIKAKNNKWFLMNRKTFRPPSNPSDIFSRVDPDLEPNQEGENLELRRLSMSRTYSRKKWRPSTQFRTNIHSATMGSTMFLRSEMPKRTFA